MKKTSYSILSSVLFREKKQLPFCYAKTKDLRLKQVDDFELVYKTGIKHVLNLRLSF